jgi:biopolymer transport protein ExbD
MLSARKKFGKKKKMALQLTSLLDMFTIILVFLMVSFQSQDKDFVLNADLALPESSAKSPFKTGVNLAITNDSVIVEGTNVFTLGKGGTVSDEMFEAGKIEGVVAGVASAWEKIKKEEGEENVVVIQADKKLPYRTIHLVMRSAAHAGFHRFRLVIVKE